MTAKKKTKAARRGTKRARRETKTASNETKAAARASEILAKLEIDGFTPKEARFVQEYPVDLNGAAAARRAGYSEATAKAIACELLAKPHIQEAVAAEMSARAERTRITQDRVLTGIADLAFYDIADLFTERGALRAVFDMPPALRAAIAGIEVEEIRFGTVVIGHVKKVKLADRKGNLELLGRHLKLFTDKFEHSATASLEEILTRSREK